MCDNIEKALTDWIRTKRHEPAIEPYVLKEIIYNGECVPLMFFIEDNGAVNPQEKRNNTLLGVMCLNKDSKILMYTSYFNLFFEDKNNSIEIIDNITKKPYRRNGIGSLALDVLKEIAYDNVCIKIWGKRIAIPDTPEESDNLWNFYAKNGFKQWEDKKYIEFDMSEYKPEYNQQL